MALMKNIAMSRGFRGFDFQISNSDLVRFNETLGTMERDLKIKIVAKALRSGGKVFLDEARARVTSDRVEKGLRGTLRTVNGEKGYIAGPSKGLPNPAWLEYGTLNKYTGRGKGGGSYRVKKTKRLMGGDSQFFTLRAGREISGGIRPRPFLRPSFDAKYPQMINKMAEVIGKELKAHGR